MFKTLTGMEILHSKFTNFINALRYRSGKEAVLQEGVNNTCNKNIYVLHELVYVDNLTSAFLNIILNPNNIYAKLR